MSFREKSAWISLVSILVVSVFYFRHVPEMPTPPTGLSVLQAFVFCIVALVVIEVVAHVVVAIQGPKDATTPMDERERLIDLKATRIAYYVFAVGAALGAVSMIQVGANALAVANHILLAFVVAEIVNYAAQIYYHRRAV